MIDAIKGEYYMEKITVWTKQHENVLKELEISGRYIARQEYIRMDLKEQAPLVLEAYDWLVKHGPDRANKPADVDYPVWVSFINEGTMMNSENTAILQLSLYPEQITSINIAKWGHILNYGYIPADEADLARHRKLLDDYGISDVKAVISQFYPQIKREIQESWNRLFDDSILMGSDARYGNIWEIRKEWVTDVIR